MLLILIPPPTDTQFHLLQGKILALWKPCNSSSSSEGLRREFSTPIVHTHSFKIRFSNLCKIENVTQVSKNHLAKIVNICKQHTLLKLKVVVWTTFFKRLALDILLANE